MEGLRTNLENYLRSALTALALVPALIPALSMPARAQDRLPPILRDAMTAAERQAAADFAAARGTEITGPFVPLLRSPVLMNRVRALGDYVRFASALPPRLSEFVILLAARHWMQQYEWSVHYPLAIGVGVNAATAAAIAEGRRPEAMTDEESTLYDFCTELQWNQSVSDVTYARLKARFGDQGIVDTIAIVGYYTLLSMVLNTARTPVPAGSAVPRLPFPR